MKNKYTTQLENVQIDKMLSEMLVVFFLLKMLLLLAISKLPRNLTVKSRHYQGM